MKTKIIRAYELQFWDVFIKQGLQYTVIKKDEEKIYFRSNNDHRGGFTSFMGAKSQERVEIILDIDNINHPSPKKIKVYDWYTRKFIGAYKNAVKAAQFIDEPGVTDSHILDYIAKKFKNPDYNLGYHFERTRM